jgi:hypothetical protein
MRDFYHRTLSCGMEIPPFICHSGERSDEESLFHDKMLFENDL